LKRVRNKMTILLGLELLINKFSESSWTILSSDC